MVLIGPMLWAALIVLFAQYSVFDVFSRTEVTLFPVRSTGCNCGVGRGGRAAAVRVQVRRPAASYRYLRPQSV